VHDRARGTCEYCLLPEAFTLAAHEVDHVVAQKHGGLTEADNLALSCTLCNRHKGSDIASIDPETMALAPLFHPRRQRWADHFRLDGANLLALTATGRVTVRLLRLNQQERVLERELILAAGALLGGEV